MQIVCISPGSHWSKDAEEKLVLSSVPLLEKANFHFTESQKEKPLIPTNLQSQTASSIAGIRQKTNTWIYWREESKQQRYAVQVGKKALHPSGKSFSSAEGRR